MTSTNMNEEINYKLWTSQKVWVLLMTLTSSVTLFILLSLSTMLCTTEFIVQSTFHQQFTVGTHFSNLTIIKHKYHISILYGWKAMCNCDTSAALLCFVQCCLNNLEELTHSYNIIFLMHCYIQHQWCDTQIPRSTACFTCSSPNSNIKINAFISAKPYWHRGVKVLIYYISTIIKLIILYYYISMTCLISCIMIYRHEINEWMNEWIDEVHCVLGCGTIQRYVCLLIVWRNVHPPPSVEVGKMTKWKSGTAIKPKNSGIGALRKAYNWFDQGSYLGHPSRSVHTT
jgi:hypothetical protein